MTTFVEEYRTAFGFMLKLIFESILHKTRNRENACPPSLRSGGQRYIRFVRIVLLSGENYDIFAKVKQVKTPGSIRVSTIFENK